MNVVIKDLKLFLGDKYFCDTATIPIPKGKYPIEFEHSERFNALMPFVVNTEKQEPVMLCWCKELCKRDFKCEACACIRIGRYFSGEELQHTRETFNQLYQKMKYSISKAKLTIEIQ